MPPYPDRSTPGVCSNVSRVVVDPIRTAGSLLVGSSSPNVVSTERSGSNRAMETARHVSLTGASLVAKTRSFPSGWEIIVTPASSDWLAVDSRPG